MMMILKLFFSNSLKTLTDTGRLPKWFDGKESACQCRRHRRRQFDPWVQKMPWRRKWQPTPVFLF